MKKINIKGSKLKYTNNKKLKSLSTKNSFSNYLTKI